MAENGERFSENGERFFTGQLYTTTYQKRNRMNMKQITMRYRKNGKTKEKKMTVSEFHQLLTSNEYVRHVRALRTIVGASININDGDIVEAERLPEIYVSVGEKGYSGLVMLSMTISERTPSLENLRRVVDMLPQTILSFVGSSGKTLKVLTSVTRPDGTLPTDLHEAELLHQHAWAMASKFYEGQTGVPCDRSAPRLTRGIRLSYDGNSHMNAQAVPFILQQPSEPLTMTLRRRRLLTPMTVIDRLPDYDELHMQMTRFQFCYADIMSRDYQEVDVMLQELARLTMRNGLDAEFCIHRLLHMHPYQNYEVLVRRTFRNVYGICFRHPERMDTPKESALPHYTLQIALLCRFMEQRYQLRRNIITDGIEFIERGSICFDWQPLLKEDINTITMQALSEGIEAWDKDVKRYVESSHVIEYDPIADFLDSLPHWDGQDRVSELAHRVPTDNQWWAEDFAVWMRAMMAQWLHSNTLHGNAMVPLLIGAQGDGKSTFCRRLLPDELVDYYTDRIDFANRNVAERMLTRFCLINIDEYDSLSRQQGAFLKHVLQKVDVKTRKLYDSQILNKHRYATFIGTTNDPTPLTDTTGSRRFMCIQLTGRIDNDSPIDHAQLYAQVKAELEAGMPSWFDHHREQRIQQDNKQFQLQDSMEEIFCEMFRKPENKDEENRLSAAQILAAMKKRYVSVRTDNSWVQRLSKMLVRKNFQHYRTNSKNLFGVASVEASWKQCS